MLYRHAYPSRIGRALVCLLGLLIGLCTAVPAQSYLPAATPAPAVASLLVPAWMLPGLPKATKLKASLKFAYLSDNRDAESLRERREYDALGRLSDVYVFSDQGGVAEKVSCTYHVGTEQAASIVVERYGKDMELSFSSQHRFNAKGDLLDYESESSEQGYYRIVNTYDAAGRLQRTQYYEKDRLPGRAETYRYDAQGRLLEQTFLDIAGEVARVVRYTHDASGHVSEAQVLEQGKALRYAVRYTYQPNGLLATMERVGREGMITERETYTYNSKGQRVRVSSLLPGESKPMETTLSYDEAGHVKEEKVIDSDGSLFQWKRFLFTATGAPRETAHLDAAGKPSYLDAREYDAQGRVLSITQRYTDGSGDAQTVFRWDQRGTILDEKHTQFGQEVEVYWYVHEYY